MNHSELQNPLTKALNFWFPYKIQQEEIPGVVVRISRGGKTLYDNAFGFADTKAKTPMSTETLFRVASMSKMFTGVAILQLIEKGSITLSTRVSKIIPEFDTDSLRTITIKNLLQHRSGVFRDSGKNYWNENAFPTDVLSDISFGTKVTEENKEFKYSNFGFAILGKIIEAVSGQSYGEYVHKNIIAKLSLKDTYPDYSDDLKSRTARGYSRKLFNQKQYAFAQSKTNEFAPAAGFVSTAKDIDIFLCDVWGEKSKVLSKKSQALLASSFKKITGTLAYGFGFKRDSSSGMQFVCHGGGYNGFITNSLYVPKEKLSVVVFTNCLDGSADVFATSILSLISWIEEMAPAEKKVNVEKYEGIYRDVWSDDCVVGANGNLLVFNPLLWKPFAPRTYLSPKGGDVFEIRSNSPFGSVGENATFRDFEDMKAQTMQYGGGILKRVL